MTIPINDIVQNSGKDDIAIEAPRQPLSSRFSHLMNGFGSKHGTHNPKPNMVKPIIGAIHGKSGYDVQAATINPRGMNGVAHKALHHRASGSP